MTDDDERPTCDACGAVDPDYAGRHAGRWVPLCETHAYKAHALGYRIRPLEEVRDR